MRLQLAGLRVRRRPRQNFRQHPMESRLQVFDRVGVETLVHRLARDGFGQALGLRGERGARRRHLPKNQRREKLKGINLPGALGPKSLPGQLPEGFRTESADEPFHKREK
jgi:hypothetical protein